MKPNDPRCSLCGRQYDAEFMTGLPCRVFSREDVVTPGCPAQRHMIADLEATAPRGTTPAAGGCLMLVLALPTLLILLPV
ncbi:hypothetical protein [Nocardiopsis sp. HUAS JQ3]|uniref:hypothetical protein n=1 Tax=unclassified Nocardiopsis TaxID=2649073 RepID=UPI0023A9B9E8|nr:hypothetical protein [Nocardiopsis sp. HUAS JQ3]WDZ93653.1 hypothetical protein PV789_14410 [Nocardiopsis sp. HUAS JQ3]